MLPLLLGVCVGFLSSIPPFGPGSLLVMRRGLEGRFVAGIAAAAGGAAADAIYCGLAVVGFSYLFWKHPDIAASMRWIGVVILSALGLWFLTRRPASRLPNGEPKNGGDWPRQAALGFSLVAFNPTLMLSWTTGIAMFASVGGVFLSGSSRFAFPIGVALGDVCWAAIALLLYRRLGSNLPDRLLRVLVRSIGLLLLALACFLAIRIALSSSAHR